jgi:hypothetical protein
MSTKTTILLAVAFGTAAAFARPAMLECVGDSGERVFSDRQIGTECREITIDPYPVDTQPMTWFGEIVVVDVSAQEPPTWQ